MNAHINNRILDDETKSLMNIRPMHNRQGKIMAVKPKIAQDASCDNLDYEQKE
jgi:hypothetical protein